MNIIKKYHIFIYVFLIISALVIIEIKLTDYKKTKSIEIVRKEVDDKTPISDSIPTIDFERIRKKYKNNDIKAALRIKNDSFEEIVFKTNNNTDYLTHNYMKKKGSGELFIDSKLDLDNSKKKVLYCYNNEKCLFFKNYFDEQYYVNHKYIELETEKLIYKYEVLLVYSGSLSYKNFNSMAVLNNSLYTYSVDFDNTNELLIINTIIDNKQIAIVSKKV